MSQDLHFELRKIVCAGFAKVAKLLAAKEPIADKAQTQLLHDMAEFIIDEQEHVRLEAFAGLASVLECVPKEIISNTTLIGALTEQFN